MSNDQGDRTAREALAAMEPDAESDPMAPLEPLDLVDALFKAAQAAIVSGEDQVEVTPECHEMAAALRAMYREGSDAMPRVRALAKQFQGSIPRIVGADDDCRSDATFGEAMDGVPLRLGDLDTARIMRMSRSALLRVIDWYVARIDESRRAVVWPAAMAGLSDDQLRAAVRQLGRCAPGTPGAATTRRPSS